MQEEIGPQASFGKDVVLGLAENPGGDDISTTLECNCYMQITGVDNMGEQYGWHLLEFIDGASEDPDVCVDGFGPLWKKCGEYMYHADYPTPFYSLGSPRVDGMHMFYAYLPLPTSVIHTKVNCYLEAEGYQQLASSVDFDFSSTNGEYTGFFYVYTEEFSCFVSPNPPGPTPGTGDQ